MKYVQSFYQYAVIYSSIGKGVPAANADGDLRNIAEFTEQELETMQNCEPLFRQLVSQKKYRILNKIPESYRPASQLVNEAREEAEKAKQELEELKAKIAAKETDTVGTETGPETEDTKAKAASKKSNKKTNKE